MLDEFICFERFISLFGIKMTEETKDLSQAVVERTIVVFVSSGKTSFESLSSKLDTSFISDKKLIGAAFCSHDSSPPFQWIGTNMLKVTLHETETTLQTIVRVHSQWEDGAPAAATPIEMMMSYGKSVSPSSSNVFDIYLVFEANGERSYLLFGGLFVSMAYQKQLFSRESVDENGCVLLTMSASVRMLLDTVQAYFQLPVRPTLEEAVRVFLDSFPSNMIDFPQSHERVTFLAAAVATNNLRLAKTLLQMGARPNHFTAFGTVKNIMEFMTKRFDEWRELFETVPNNYPIVMLFHKVPPKMRQLQSSGSVVKTPTVTPVEGDEFDIPIPKCISVSRRSDLRSDRLHSTLPNPISLSDTTVEYTVEDGVTLINWPS